MLVPPLAPLAGLARLGETHPLCPLTVFRVLPFMRHRRGFILLGMPIDAFTSTFADMAAVILPGNMARLRAALDAPVSMSSFCKRGFGIKSILSGLRRSSDFSGCYVLLREGEPFYVGISRTVVQRLRQHVTGKTHFDASLAY